MTDEDGATSMIGAITIDTASIETATVICATDGSRRRRRRGAIAPYRSAPESAQDVVHISPVTSVADAFGVGEVRIVELVPVHVLGSGTVWFICRF